MSLLVSRPARWRLLALCLLACPSLGTAAQRREATPNSADATLLVRVVDQEGAPLPEAEVFSCSGKFAGRAGEAVRLSRHYVREGLTDERGLFEVPRTTERITIACRHNESLYYRSARLGQETEVTIAVLPLPVERVIEGIVLGPEEEPIEGGKVRYYWHSPESEERFQVAPTDAEGRFRILLNQPVAKGSLHAVGPPELLLNSKVVSGIRSEGVASLTIQLDSRDSLEVLVKDENGQAVPGASAGFSWWIEGRRVRVDEKERQQRGALKWERPNVPFFIGVYAKGYESTHMEKVRPDPTRGRIEVVLRARPRIRLRASHNGQTLDAFRYRVTGSARALGGLQPKDGYADYYLYEPGTYRVQAWSEEAGLSRTQEVHVPVQNPQVEVTLELDEQLGSIDGKILFPPGHPSSEILLQGSWFQCLRVLNPDGTFQVEGLPPGPIHLQLVSLPLFRPRPVDGWVRGLHVDWVHPDGSGKAPDWIQPERDLWLDIKPGPPTPYLLDLRELPPYQLLGHFELDGQPMSEDAAWLLGRCWRLHHPEERGEYHTRAALDARGQFLLGSWEQGSYRLSAKLAVANRQDWEISDTVDLTGPSTSWEFISRTGGLLLEQAGGTPRWRGSVLWSGPGDLKIHCRPRFEPKGPITCAPVPVGRVQVLDSKGKLLREVVIEPGKQTKLLLD